MRVGRDQRLVTVAWTCSGVDLLPHVCSNRPSFPSGDAARRSLQFPTFVRFAYAWRVVADRLEIWAALAVISHGIWRASRHALTVRFLALMVFAIGHRVLPLFSGMRLLFSTKLMFLVMPLLGAASPSRPAHRKEIA